MLKPSVEVRCPRCEGRGLEVNHRGCTVVCSRCRGMACIDSTRLRGAERLDPRPWPWADMNRRLEEAPDA